MTRVPGRPGAARGPSSMARAKFRKHKVIMESITQARKKLRSIISFEAKAPQGYTFIPAGNPHLTSACKEMCRKEGMKILAVTTTPHQSTHGLSQQVHRMGYHFPSVVVATVCMDLGLHLTATGKAVPFEKFGSRPAVGGADSETSQTTINTEARDVIRDLFPNIPDNDTNQIIKTAFQKGQRKVGTAAELPLARRAQLAAVAHIRHVYTEYDRLLKKTSFQEARRRVEESTLEKLVQWRGDDENGKSELEDVFREVIVISDDDDEDDSDEDHPHQPISTDRDPSIEIVSSNTIASDLVTRTLNYEIPSTGPLQDLSEDEAPSGFRFVSDSAPRKANKSKVDRRGFSRYQAWDRAKDRYRERISGSDHLHALDTQVIADSSLHSSQRLLYNVAGSSSEIVRGRQIFQPRPVLDKAPEMIDVARPRSDPQFHHREFLDRRNIDPLAGASASDFPGNHYYPQIDSRTQTQSRFPFRAAPDVLRLPDGSVFEKIPTPIVENPVCRPADVSSAPVFISGPTATVRGHENSRKRVYVSENTPSKKSHVETSPHDRIILPSIEISDTLPAMRALEDNRRRDIRGIPHEHHGVAPELSWRPVEDLSQGIRLIKITDSVDENTKRRRLDFQEPLYHISSVRDEPLPAFTEALERPARSSIPSFNHVSKSATRHEGTDQYGMHTLSRDNPQMTTSHGSPYSWTLRSKVVPDSRRATSNREDDTTIPDSPERHPGVSRRSPFNSRVVSLPQNGDHHAGNDSYLTRYVTHHHTDPVFDNQSRGSGLDAPTWRSKANLYESERRLISAQWPSKPTEIQGFRTALHVRQPGVPKRDFETVPSSHDRTPEAMTVNQNRRPLQSETSSLQYHRQHGVRGTASDSGLDPIEFDRYSSQLNRRKDTLPASAVRRYEVQLEKSLNSNRSSTHSRLAMQDHRQDSRASNHRPDNPNPQGSQPSQETPIIVLD